MACLTSCAQSISTDLNSYSFHGSIGAKLEFWMIWRWNQLNSAFVDPFGAEISTLIFHRTDPTEDFDWIGFTSFWQLNVSSSKI